MRLPRELPFEVALPALPGLQHLDRPQRLPGQQHRRFPRLHRRRRGGVERTGWPNCSTTAEETGADAVLGPVRAVYSDAAPGWMRARRFPLDAAGLGRRARSAPATPATCSCAATSPHVVGPPLQPRARPHRRRGHRIFHPAVRSRRHDRLCARGAGLRAGAGQSRTLLLAGEAPLQGRPDPWPAARRRTRRRPACSAKLGLAAAKAGYCFAAAAARSSFLPVQRNRYALRGVMHAGAVSGLLGLRELRLYGDERSEAAAMQPDVSFVDRRLQRRGVDRPRHRKRARPARCEGRR